MTAETEELGLEHQKSREVFKNTDKLKKKAEKAIRNV